MMYDFSMQEETMTVVKDVGRKTQLHHIDTSIDVSLNGQLSRGGPKSEVFHFARSGQKFGRECWQKIPLICPVSFSLSSTQYKAAHTSLSLEPYL